MPKVRAGMKIGQWTVLKCIDKKAGSWLCACTCGAQHILPDYRLHPERRSRLAHSTNSSPEYRAWQNMRQRCINPRHPSYADYGGRGIKICPRWESFAAFYEDMGKRPSPRHSLDRMLNGGDYEPGNCRWATPSKQNRNRRNKRKMTLKDLV